METLNGNGKEKGKVIGWFGDVHAYLSSGNKPYVLHLYQWKAYGIQVVTDEMQNNLPFLQILKVNMFELSLEVF